MVVETQPDLAAFWRSRIPAGELGDPEDIGALVAYLASSASRYVVGQSIVIDGGYTIVCKNSSGRLFESAAKLLPEKYTGDYADTMRRMRDLLRAMGSSTGTAKCPGPGPRRLWCFAAPAAGVSGCRAPRTRETLSMFEESTMDGPVSTGWPPPMSLPLVRFSHSEWTAR